MNRYLVQLYIGIEKFSYPQEAESADKAYKQAEAAHFEKGLPEPDCMSVTLHVNLRAHRALNIKYEETK